MSYEITQICKIAVTVINSLTILCNILGIYLLKASLLGKSVQTQIILSLSCCDILMSGGSLAVMILDICGHKLVTSKVAQVVWAHSVPSVCITWFNMYYLLTFDRFLACNFPFRYRALALTKKCRIVVGISWAITMILGPTFSILNTTKVKAFYFKYLFVTCDSLFLCLFFVTYGSVFYRKKQSTQNVRRQHADAQNQRFFKLTAAMLAAFLIFETIPSFGSAILAMDNSETRYLFEIIFQLCWHTNLLVDPFIYIFLMPRIRQTAVKKLRSLQDIIRKNSTSALSSNSSTQNISLRAHNHVAQIVKDEEKAESKIR